MCIFEQRICARSLASIKKNVLYSDKEFMSFPAYFSAGMLGMGFMVAANVAIGRPDGASFEIIKPEEIASSIKPAAIDSEKFELGAYVGMLSVEDFNTNRVAGLSLSYHINSRFMAQLNYGESSVGRATFEEVSEGNFLSDKNRDFEYTALLAGYKLMNGRSFLGENHKFLSDIYLMLGAASVDFAGEDNAGVMFGVNYKATITDWLTLNLDFRDIVVDREFLGSNKATHNTEVTLGINAFF
jgi:outer membrane beta-barrel protein